MNLILAVEDFFAQAWVQHVLWAIVLAIVIGFACRVCERMLRHVLDRDDNPLPSSTIFVNIVRATIWIVGGSFILDNCFGINANALITALGVGGIAISLGFQDTLSNLIGGVQVSFMGLVKPGDNIEVGGKSGVVQDVTWRHTTIVDSAGQTIVVPNSTISKNTLVHLLPAGRVVVPVAVADTARWTSLDELGAALKETTQIAVTPLSSLAAPPTVAFLEITELGVKGKIIFEIADASATFAANDACVRAVAKLIA